MKPGKPLHHGLWALALAALLGLIFWLYSRPDFVVQLADQLWACF